MPGASAGSSAFTSANGIAVAGGVAVFLGIGLNVSFLGCNVLILEGLTVTVNPKKVDKC